MILTTVLPYGRVALGPEAAAVGFVEGAVIELVVLSTGSVLLRLDDTPAVDTSARLLRSREKIMLDGSRRREAR